MNSSCFEFKIIHKSIDNLLAYENKVIGHDDHWPRLGFDLKVGMITGNQQSVLRLCGWKLQLFSVVTEVKRLL